jgi:hypothetical protein
MNDAAPGLANHGLEQNKAVMRLEFFACLDRNQVGFAFDIDGEGEGLVLDHDATVKKRLEIGD